MLNIGLKRMDYILGMIQNNIIDYFSDKRKIYDE